MPPGNCNQFLKALPAHPKHRTTTFDSNLLSNRLRGFRNCRKNPNCDIPLTFPGAASAALQLLVSLTAQWLLSLARGARSTTRLSGLGLGWERTWKLEGSPPFTKKACKKEKVLPDCRFQQFPAKLEV